MFYSIFELWNRAFRHINGLSRGSLYCLWLTYCYWYAKFNFFRRLLAITIKYILCPRNRKILISKCLPVIATLKVLNVNFTLAFAALMDRTNRKRVPQVLCLVKLKNCSCFTQNGSWLWSLLYRLSNDVSMSFEYYKNFRLNGEQRKSRHIYIKIFFKRIVPRLYA